MTAYIFDYAGRKITEQRCRTSFDALGLVKLYGNWQYVIVTSGDGTPCEMFYRL